VAPRYRLRRVVSRWQTGRSSALVAWSTTRVRRDLGVGVVLGVVSGFQTVPL
jgi:hypothetical protein